MTEIHDEESRLELTFDANGLVPAICQNADTGNILMLGYMNKEAVSRTISSGHVWFFSRSRQELWHKGATSGNFLHVVSITADCDDDAILLRVNPQGPTCHTGEFSCFHHPIAP